MNETNHTTYILISTTVLNTIFIVLYIFYVVFYCNMRENTHTKLKYQRYGINNKIAKKEEITK